MVKDNKNHIKESTVLEPSREIPVIDEVDVLVVGGGPTGTDAALSSAAGMAPRQLDTSYLREVLRRQGVLL